MMYNFMTATVSNAEGVFSLETKGLLYVSPIDTRGFDYLGSVTQVT